MSHKIKCLAYTRGIAKLLAEYLQLRDSGGITPTFLFLETVCEGRYLHCIMKY